MITTFWVQRFGHVVQKTVCVPLIIAEDFYHYALLMSSVLRREMGFGMKDIVGG